MGLFGSVMVVTMYLFQTCFTELFNSQQSTTLLLELDHSVLQFRDHNPARVFVLLSDHKLVLKQSCTPDLQVTSQQFG
jgi:hypothetical protein